MDPFRLQIPGPPDVVDVVGVPPIDDGVVGLHPRGQVLQCAVHDGGRHHQPRGARLRERGRKFIERGGADGALLDQPVHRLAVSVVDDAVMSPAYQAADHIGAHPAESDHAELHTIHSFRGDKSKLWLAVCLAER